MSLTIPTLQRQETYCTENYVEPSLRMNPQQLEVYVRECITSISQRASKNESYSDCVHDMLIKVTLTLTFINEMDKDLETLINDIFFVNPHIEKAYISRVINKSVGNTDGVDVLNLIPPSCLRTYLNRKYGINI